MARSLSTRETEKEGWRMEDVSYLILRSFQLLWLSAKDSCLRCEERGSCAIVYSSIGWRMLESMAVLYTGTGK
jgi:hypothetical protein